MSFTRGCREIFKNLKENIFPIALLLVIGVCILFLIKSAEIRLQNEPQKRSEKNFKEAVAFVLSKEGIYSIHTQDKGGVTKYGITTTSNPEIDIETLSESQAIEIYKQQYWDKTLIPMIEDKNLRIKFFDASVNVGYVQATKLLQRALNCTGVESIVDGVFGKKTLANVNKCKNSFGLQYAFIAFLVNFYDDLVQRDPRQAVFLTGWMNRAHDVVGD